MSKYRELRENQYFRVKYRKLDSPVRLSSDLRCDMRFEVDRENIYTFSLYPLFENVTDVRINEYCEAKDEGTAIVCKPIHPDKDGYYEMIRKRVKVGAKAYFSAGTYQFAELEITEILSDI